MMKLSGKVGKFGVAVVIGALTVGGVAVAKPGVAKDSKTVPEDAMRPPSSSNYYVTAAVWATSTKLGETRLQYDVQVFGSGGVNPVTTVSATVTQDQCNPASDSGSGSGTVYVGILNGTFISGVTNPQNASTIASAAGLTATATCTPVSL